MQNISLKKRKQQHAQTHSLKIDFAQISLAAQNISVAQTLATIFCNPFRLTPSPYACVNSHPKYG